MFLNKNVGLFAQLPILYFISVVPETVVYAAVDPYFNNVSLLITSNGIDGTGNKTFIDSASGLTVSVGAGQPTQGSFNPFNSNYACLFNSTSYLIAAPSTPLELGSGDFTIECWAYINSKNANNSGIISKGLVGTLDSTSWAIEFNGSANTLSFWTHSANSSTYIINGSINVVNGQWNHIAVVKSGTSTKMFINGIQDGATYSGAYTIGAGNNLYIGMSWFATTRTINGYISNVRILKGYALYTSNFTPQAVLSNSPLGVPQSSVSLLTLQDGAFIDLSTNNNTISAVGSPRLEVISSTLSSASLTAVQYPPAYDSTLHNSVLFDGSSYVSAPNSSILDLGSGDWTIECYVNFSSYSNNTTLIGKGSIGSFSPFVIIVYSNTLLLYSSSNNTSWDLANGLTIISSTVATNTWYHIAVVRKNGIISTFSNGVNISNSSYSANSISTNSSDITIGSGSGGANKMTGYVSNVRIIKGTALYTSNFTPSVSGLTSTQQTSLLTCQDSTIRDNSSNNLALSSVGNPTVTTLNPFGVSYSDYKQGFYGGSGYFDGSSSLTTNNSSIAFGTGNFTIEAWIYPTDSAERIIVGTRGSAGVTTGFTFAKNPTTNTLYVYTNTYICTTTAAVPLNTWTHVAFVRSGTGANQSVIYINGVASASGTSTNDFTNTAIGIGSTNDSSAQFWLGYISNLRIIKGSALYTANFAPPTAPVRPTGNTSLLLNFANGGIVDATKKNNFIQYGTASVSTSASKFGGGSMYFDGSSRLIIPRSNNLIPSASEDFTIEAWVYPTNFTASQTIAGFVVNLVNSDWILGINASTGVPYFRINPSNTNYTGTVALTLNSWNHIAISRSSSNSLRFFVNGVLTNMFTDAGTLNSSTGYNFSIGADQNGAAAFNGYIDDLRITKGIARYTSNFSVPTRELASSNVALPDGDTYFNNVSLLLNGNGLSGAQNNTFRDSSTNNFTVTRYGTTTQGSFSPFNTLGNVYNVGVNGGSGLFGLSNYLEFPNPSTIWNSIVGGSGNKGPVTTEAWIYMLSNYTGGSPSQVEDMSPIISKVGSSIFGVSPTGKLRFYWFDSVPSRRNLDSTDTISLSTWTHVAVTVDTNVTLYINGKQNGSTAFNGNISGLNETVRIGRYVGGYTSLFDGYISNLRITTATLYTATFTPPTSPVTLISNGGATPSTAPTAAQTSLLLNFTDAGIVDAVGKNDLVTVDNARIDTGTKKYGTGSMYFDGTGDYLTVPATTQFNFGTGDWTVEFWIYPLAYGGTLAGGQLFGTSNASQTGYSIVLGQTKDTFRMISNARGTWADDISVSAGGGPDLNTWTHYAIVRSGSNLAMYKNGISVATASSIGSYNYSGTTAVIGRFNDGANIRDYNGYIDDLRVTKGVARYTTNFTPPTSALPIQCV